MSRKVGETKTIHFVALGLIFLNACLMLGFVIECNHQVYDIPDLYKVISISTVKYFYVL